MLENKKISFSLLNWFGASQAEIVKLQNVVKGAFASATIGTYVGTDVTKSIIVAALGALVCEVVGCLRIEDKN